MFTTEERLAKRLAIAHELLLRCTQMKLVSCIYIASDKKLEGDIKEKITDAIASCEVCGIGAVFLATVSLYNECSFESINTPGYRSGFISFGTQLGRYLQPYFDDEELAIIEAIFEAGETRSGHFNEIASEGLLDKIDVRFANVSLLGRVQYIANYLINSGGQEVSEFVFEAADERCYDCDEYLDECRCGEDEEEEDEVYE